VEVEVMEVTEVRAGAHRDLEGLLTVLPQVLILTRVLAEEALIARLRVLEGALLAL
jgi:hypothetical protein